MAWWRPYHILLQPLSNIYIQYYYNNLSRKRIIIMVPSFILKAYALTYINSHLFADNGHYDWFKEFKPCMIWCSSLCSNINVYVHALLCKNLCITYTIQLEWSSLNLYEIYLLIPDCSEYWTIITSTLLPIQRQYHLYRCFYS